MVGTSMNEEMDCGSFFDQIDNLLEFPNDEFENIFIGNQERCDGFPAAGGDGVGDIWSSSHVSFEHLPDTGSAFPAQKSDDIITTTADSGLDDNLPVPYEDIVQLEWLSTFVEESFLGGNITTHGTNNSSFIREFSQSQAHFHSASSPVSVLESSSSCSSGKTMPLSHDKRPRSKRPRPSTFNPRTPMHLMPLSPELENVLQSRPVKKVTKPVKVVQKKSTTPKPLLPAGLQEMNPAEDQNANPSQPVRKCEHCEITKTPQWRAGPNGPKTLCNACGVRYKSGRLFPEYRPAASPTFAPSLHSNSHRKVLEMRNRKMAVKSESPAPATTVMAKKTTAAVSSLHELIPAFI